MQNFIPKCLFYAMSTGARHEILSYQNLTSPIRQQCRDEPLCNELKNRTP